MFELEKIKKKTINKYPFFCSLASGCRIILTEKLPTAATDGKNIFINPAFMETLDEDGQVFTFAHEIMHIASNHIMRSDGKIKQLWNIATDAVINQTLKRDGAVIFEGLVDMPEALNKKAETIYEKLLSQAKEQNRQQDGSGEGDDSSKVGQSGQNGQTGQGDEQGLEGQASQQQQGQAGQNQTENGSKQSNGSDEQSQQDAGQGSNEENSQGQDSEGGENAQSAGFDNHDIWEEAVKNFKEGKGLASDFEKELQGEQSEEEKARDEARQKKIEEESAAGEDEMIKKNDEAVKEALDKMLDSLGKRMASRGGNGTSGTFKRMEEIGKARPLINWKMHLRNSAKIHSEWSYRNAEVEYGVVNPRREKYAEPQTEIMLDVSGSVSEELLKNFLRECKNILQVSRIKVGQFNTRFIDFQEIRNVSDIDKLKFNIGGGTDFNVAVENFSRSASNKIIFTDGKASMPKEKCQAIWVVFGGKKIKPNGGKVIQIPAEALAKLKEPQKNSLSR